MDLHMPDEMDDHLEYFEVFNYGVLRNEMKWYHNEPRENEFNYESADEYMDLFDQKGVPLRGHAVFWSVDQFVQDWVQNKALTNVVATEQDLFDRVST